MAVLHSIVYILLFLRCGTIVTLLSMHYIIYYSRILLSLHDVSAQLV